MSSVCLVVQDFIGTVPWDYRLLIEVLVGQVVDWLGAPSNPTRSICYRLSDSQSLVGQGYNPRSNTWHVDRAMRGETSPSPVYEGESGVIAYMLDGPEACYTVSLPEPGKPLRAILDTFTKAHSAVNHAQAFIDLAFELRQQVDLSRVCDVVIHTNSTVHHIVGSGANDPEKYNPDASRETLDHSLSYIVAVALEDRRFHHEHSYTPERAHRSTTIDLWHKACSVIDPTWEALYRQARQDQPALGGRLELHLDDGRVIAGEKAVADAHTHGAHPMGRAGYREKFRTLASPVLEPCVLEGFLTLAHELPDASPEALGRLNPSLPAGKVQPDRPDGRGIFDHGLVASGGLQH